MLIKHNIIAHCRLRGFSTGQNLAATALIDTGVLENIFFSE
jgi:hypothetical protein